jgi:hypothetical protein
MNSYGLNANLQSNTSGGAMSKIMGFLHTNITTTTILYVV